MLTLTDHAIAVIRDICATAPEGERAGLRIEVDPTTHAKKLQIRVAQSPEADDQVIEDQGAQVFLPSETASTLATMELDAIVGERNIQFQIRKRP